MFHTNKQKQSKSIFVIHKWPKHEKSLDLEDTKVINRWSPSRSLRTKKSTRKSPFPASPTYITSPGPPLASLPPAMRNSKSVARRGTRMSPSGLSRAPSSPPKARSTEAKSPRQLRPTK